MKGSILRLTLAVPLLAGCLSTMQVWKKAGVTPEEDRRDHISCGAVPEGPNKTTVYEKDAARFAECMRRLGYASTTVTPTSSNWQINRQSTATVDDPEYRASISNNAVNVTVDETCAGLFVPKLEEEMFRNAVPAWFAYFLNNSSNRYTVQYDLQVRETGATYFGKYDETSAQERTLVVRPREFAKFPILQGRGGTKVISVNVFKCSPDGRTSASTTPTTTTPNSASPSTQSARPGDARPPGRNSGPPLANRDLILAVQSELKRRGFYDGPVDGQAGAKTRGAISKFQFSIGLVADGLATLDLLTRLRGR